MAQVDQKFLDLFTVIDNLLKENQALQNKTNQLLETNNYLLENLVRKETILQAPQLTTINVESVQKASATPQNLDIIPAIHWNIDDRKWYVALSTFIQSGWNDIGIGTPDGYGNIVPYTVDTGDISLNQFLPEIDLWYIRQIKLAGYGMSDAVTNKPENVRFIFRVNQRTVTSIYVQPENVVIYPTDPNDPTWWLYGNTKFRQILQNFSTTLFPRVYLEFWFILYKNISDESALGYLKRIKEVV